MNFRKPARTVFLLAFALALASSAAYADGFEAIKLTVSDPIEIPNKVLPAGTYWFQRAGLSQPNMLEVRNADRTQVVTTLFTRPERLVPKATGGIGVTFTEGVDAPPSLIGVTFPGKEEGHAFDFAYPDARQKELTEYRQVTRVLNDSGDLSIEKTTEKTSEKAK